MNLCRDLSWVWTSQTCRPSSTALTEGTANTWAHHRFSTTHDVTDASMGMITGTIQSGNR